MEVVALQEYARLERYYWWWIGRRSIIRAMLERYSESKKPQNILDWGCGPGGNFPALTKFGSVLGVDASPEALRFCRDRGYSNVEQFNTVSDFTAAHPGVTFDVVTALDVTEHIRDDVGFLRDLGTLLKPGGTLVITVPAYQFLWSEVDDMVSHVRRYTRTRIAAAVRSAGFDVGCASYFVATMTPAIILYRWLGKLTGRSKTPKISYVEFPQPINWLLTKTIEWEARLLKTTGVSLPFGTSIVVAAKKPRSVPRGADVGVVPRKSERTLVTGASSGIGRALTRQLVSSGGQVWGVARRREALETLRQELGEQFFYSVADIAEPDAARVCAEMDKAGFSPDAVVLNAAKHTHDADENFSHGIAREVLATNVNGALAFVGLLLPKFLQRGFGQFLAVSSITAIRPDPRGVSYAASKAALTMAFRSLALRYRTSPIQFKTVLFGPIDTECHRTRPKVSFHLKSADDAAAALRRTLAGGRRIVYYPRLIGAIFRGTGFLADDFFETLVTPFRR